jgi:hypothetical protein
MGGAVYKAKDKELTLGRYQGHQPGLHQKPNKTIQAGTDPGPADYAHRVVRI